MSRLAILIVACLILMPGAVSAQEDQEETAPSEIDRLKAETDLLNAQTNKLKAEQDAEKAKKQNEIDRIKADKDLLDAQNATEKAKRQDEIDKLKAQKDLVEAATPDVSGLPKGTVTFDDKAASSIESTVKAYEAVQILAKTVADKILTGRTDGTFVILSSADKSALASLSVFDTQVGLIIKRLVETNNLKNSDSLKLPDEVSAPSAALTSFAMLGPAINAATSLVSLFKVDDKFVPKDETANLRAVYAALAVHLQGNGRTVYYPEVMPPYMLEVAPSDVQKKLDDVTAALDTLWATYFARQQDKTKATKLADDTDGVLKKAALAAKLRAEIAAIDKELMENPTPARRRALLAQKREKEAAIPGDAITDTTVLNNKRKYLALLKAFIESNDDYIALLESVLKAGNDYVATMTKADATTMAPIAALISTERLRRAYRANLDKTYAVDVSVERLTGTRKERTRFFGSSLSFSGGVVLSYRVFAANTGALLVSDAVSLVRPFTKVQEQ